jgi:hypothetical protein
MKWQKRGLIFNPLEHKLAKDFVGYAQSPQTLELDDRLRIYFSTRERTADGKFISHIQYVDYDKTLSQIIDVSQHQVIAPGALGTFDEHGIFPINPVRVGSRILAYISGWSRRVSVSVETGIGIAESFDQGKTFTRLFSGPVLSSSLFERNLVVDGFVRPYQGLLHMWYIYGLGWKQKDRDTAPDRLYKIAHATSTDGLNWQKDSHRIIADLIEDECQALPTVLYFSGKYHMYFAYRSMHDFRSGGKNAYKLGYAWSTDLVQWHRHDEQAGLTLSAEGWDCEMMSYPHLFECEGKVYLLYNGNQFGKEGFGLAEWCPE